MTICNNILKELNLNIVLKNMNNNIVKNINKKKEFELLEMPLKELLSKDISPKFTSLSADYNKRRIEQILKERRDNNIPMYIFNMTYREWIDIFTMKKSIKTNKNISEEICQAIEKNMKKLLIY